MTNTCNLCGKQNSNDLSNDLSLDGFLYTKCRECAEKEIICLSDYLSKVEGIQKRINRLESILSFLYSTLFFVTGFSLGIIIGIKNEFIFIAGVAFLYVSMLSKNLILSFFVRKWRNE